MSDPSIDLLEAEELRKAIIGGEVDAFVVGREDGNRKVLLLANAYQRYRQLVERMHEGAITTSPQGGILYANQRFSELLGISLAQIYTAPLQSYVRVTDRARLAAFLARGMPSTLDIALVSSDGGTVPVRLSIAGFDSYASILVTELKPLEWPRFAAAALHSMRDSLDKLEDADADSRGRHEALANLREQLDALDRLVEAQGK
ncbi:MAG TPA: PAS domain-containing protein [Burkholderiales bacterium]|nr:PAS domain-containing protein [Burkholderiales bacterium]